MLAKLLLSAIVAASPIPRADASVSKPSSHYDAELNIFGHVLRPEEGVDLPSIRYLALLSLHNQYVGFGWPEDALRIANIAENVLSREMNEHPSDFAKQNLMTVRFWKVLDRFALGDTQGVSDGITSEIASASLSTDTLVARSHLSQLSNVLLRAGWFHPAEAVALQALRLSQPLYTANGSYFPPESTEQIAASKECTELINKQTVANQKAAADMQKHIEVPADAFGDPQALAKCTQVEFRGLARLQERMLHVDLLNAVSQASLALGEWPAAEHWLRKGSDASVFYSGTPNALFEINLSKLLRAKGEPEWADHARLARKSAKREVGLTEEAAYSGQFMPTQWVTGTKDIGGIGAGLLARAGDTELLLGRPEIALSFLTVSLPVADRLLGHSGTDAAQAHYLKGLAYLASSRAQDAEKDLRIASDDYESFAPSSRDLRRTRLSRFEGAADIHLALLDAALRANDQDTAGIALGRASRSGVGRSVDAALARLNASNPDAVRRAQDAARLASEADQRVDDLLAKGASIEELKVAVEAAKKADASAAETLKNSLASDARGELFASQSDFNIKNIQAQLPADAAELVIALSRDRSFAAIVTPFSFRAVSLSMSSWEIQKLAERVRVSCEFKIDKQNITTRPFDYQAASALWQQLVAPFEPELSRVNRIYIARTPPLDGLSFATLWDPVRKNWFADRFAYSILLDPSAPIRPASTRKVGELDFLGIGDPHVSLNMLVRDLTIDGVEPLKPQIGEDSHLLGAKDELETLAAAFVHGSKPKILTWDDATELNAAAELRKPYRIIAFATHAATRNLKFNLDTPAIVLTPRSRNGNNDGLLQPDEIEKFDLHADLVILSACQTAASDGLPGSEALSGLAQAFLYAGAHSVMATLWSVDSNSASILMSQAVRTEHNGDIAIGLHNAMSKLRAQTNTSHPAYWAPFVIVN